MAIGTNKLVLIKLGGGLITDKKVRYGLRKEVLERLVKEIAEGVKRSKGTHYIVGNGAGSFAHWSAKEYRTAEGFVDEGSRVGMGIVRHDAVKLNQIVVEELLKAGVPAFSFAPSSLMSVKNGEVKEVFLESMRDALEKGMVPVVHGDVVVDEHKGSVIFSTEKVFAVLASSLAESYEKVEIIHLSSEEGVLANGGVVEEITRSSFSDVKEVLAGSGGVDVTGGMLHKVEESLELTEKGIESVIVSGLKEGRLKETLSGGQVVGTRIR